MQNTARVQTNQELQQRPRLRHRLATRDRHAVTTRIQNALDKVRRANKVALAVRPTARVEAPAATMLATLDPDNEPTARAVHQRGEVNPHQIEQRNAVSVAVLLNPLQTRLRVTHIIHKSNATGARTKMTPSHFKADRTTFENHGPDGAGTQTHKKTQQQGRPAKRQPPSTCYFRFLPTK